MAEREPGLYWVKFNGYWTIGQLDCTAGLPEQWSLIGDPPVDECEFDEIGERVERGAISLSDHQLRVLHQALAVATSVAKTTGDLLGRYYTREQLQEHLQEAEAPDFDWRQIGEAREPRASAWPEPQPITDEQKTGEDFLLWDPKWQSWDKGHWSAATGKGRWHFPENYAEENEITHYLPLPPDVKP